METMVSEESGAFSFACGCGRVWEEVWPLPMLTKVMAGRLRNLLCPTCGKGELSFIIEKEADKVPLKKTG